MRKIFKNLHIDGLINHKNDNDIMLSVNGELSSYDVSVSYIEKCDAINVSTLIDIDFSGSDITLLKDMILEINNRVLVGKFEFILEEKTPRITFSVSQPFVREMNIEMTLISRLLEIAINAVETFYPCLEAIKDGDLRNVDDIDLFVYEQSYIV